MIPPATNNIEGNESSMAVNEDRSRTYHNNLRKVELCVLPDSTQYILKLRRDWNQLIHGGVVVVVVVSFGIV
jgi:hypothetical protein